MDFTSALLYPFKSIAKVLTIVLVMTIASAIFLGMVINSFNWIGWLEAVQYTISYNIDYIPFYEAPGALFIPGILGFLGVIIIGGFWVNGYSLRVIRHVMDGYEKLPSTQLGQDMGRGFFLWIAQIIYGALFFAFFIVVAMLTAMFSGANGESGLAGLMFCSGFLIAIPLICFMGWAYFIGMARAAAEDSTGPLFQIGTNLSLAKQNVKASFSLTGFMILLGLTYWFLSQFVTNVLNFITVPFFGNSYNETSVLIVFVLFLLTSIALNIFQQFSSMHLIAQFGANIGIVDDYDYK